MRPGARVAGVHLRVVLLNELQYRANFFVQLLESAVLAVTGLIALSVIFDHTTTLNGWTRPQLLVVMGIYTAVGGLIGFAIEPNMQRLLADVHVGTFDHVLTKPVDSQLLASLRQFNLWRLIDVVIGGGLVIWGVAQLGDRPAPGEIAGLGLTLVAGMVLVYCLWLIVTAGSFWFVRMNEVQDLFTGMYRAGQYPVTVYPTWLKLIMLYLVPIGFAVTVPAESVTGRLTLTRVVAMVIFLCVVAAVTRTVWRLGTRRYAGASA